MRLDMILSSIVLFLIFVIYFIELNQDFYLEMGKSIDNPKDEALYESNQYWITLNWPFKLRLFPVSQEQFTIINKIETLIFYIIIILLVIGFISYGGEIKDSLSKRKRTTWFNVIDDTDVCKLKDRKGFWQYFKIGLGLKF
jgi:hypothetical protein